MNHGKPFTRVDKRVELAPLHFGSRTIRPVARINGWYAATVGTAGSGAGAALRAAPVEVIVEDNGRESRVAIDDPLREPLSQLVKRGVAVSVICALVMLVVWVVARSKVALQRNS